MERDRENNKVKKEQKNRVGEAVLFGKELIERESISACVYPYHHDITCASEKKTKKKSFFFIFC